MRSQGSSLGGWLLAFPTCLLSCRACHWERRDSSEASPLLLPVALPCHVGSNDQVAHGPDPVLVEVEAIALLLLQGVAEDFLA
jgi:hypothetical protein